jgi:hypothetical protein
VAFKHHTWYYCIHAGATTSKKSRFFLSARGEKINKKIIGLLAPILVTLVAVLEFDGRHSYHRKEHLLLLLLVPNSAKSPLCEGNYINFPVIK